MPARLGWVLTQTGDHTFADRYLWGSPQIDAMASELERLDRSLPGRINADPEGVEKGLEKARDEHGIQIDLKMPTTGKVEEQNRNQLTFGAGVSQFEGFFGQLSFQTSNFLGRGETFTISAQQGSRAKNYQLAFTTPYLFDRPMTAGVDIFNREFEYIGLYTQQSRGGNIVYGFQVQDFARMFINYSLEQIEVKDLNPAFLTLRRRGISNAAVLRAMDEVPREHFLAEVAHLRPLEDDRQGVESFSMSIEPSSRADRDKLSEALGRDSSAAARRKSSCR